MTGTTFMTEDKYGQLVTACTAPALKNLHLEMPAEKVDIMINNYYFCKVWTCGQTCERAPVGTRETLQAMAKKTNEMTISMWLEKK